MSDLDADLLREAKAWNGSWLTIETLHLIDRLVARVEALEQDCVHEEHEKLTVAEAGQAYAKWARKKIAVLQQRLTEATENLDFIERGKSLCGNPAALCHLCAERQKDAEVIRALVARVEELKSERNCDDPQACGELLRDVEFQAKQQVADLQRRLTETEAENGRLMQENLGLACAGDIPNTEAAARKVAITRMHAAERQLEAQRAALVRLEQEMRKVGESMRINHFPTGYGTNDVLKRADEIAAIAAAPITKA